jgi:ribosomal-protein-alanine N-acetyltransferase
MRQIKRLSVEAPQGTYALSQRGLLRSVELTEAQVREIEREHGDHIVVDGEAVLIARPRGHEIDLHYAFPDRDAFIRNFPPMFGRIVAVVRPSESPMGYRIRLRATADRPYVEPVLRAQDFSPAREWWRMTAGLGTATQVELPAGYELRRATSDDAEAIIAIDQASFSTPWLHMNTSREVLRDQQIRVLADSTGRVVGYLRLRSDYTGAGYIADVAVHAEYQRRGLGEAMLRWALAWFREQSYERAALTVNADNNGAIALYRKLGFAAAEAGVDYRRPSDEEELRQQRERQLGAHIKVRRRY